MIRKRARSQAFRELNDRDKERLAMNQLIKNIKEDNKS